MSHLLIGLIMSVLVAVTIGLIVGYSLLTERLAARRPKSAPAPEGETHAPRRRTPVVSRPIPSSPSLTDLLLARLLRTERTNAVTSVQERSAHSDARSGVQMGARVQAVHDENLPNSREELQQLIAAVLHKRDGKTKQEAVERAFNIKKGGSPAWKRASDLFDAATTPPSRYQEYTPGEMAVLQPASGHDE